LVKNIGIKFIQRQIELLVSLQNSGKYRKFCSKSKTLRFGLKPEAFVQKSTLYPKNRTFVCTSKFWSKIETLSNKSIFWSELKNQAKHRNYGPKSKLLIKIENQHQNFGPKSTLYPWSKFEIRVK